MTSRPTTPVFTLALQDVRQQLARLEARVDALQAAVEELLAQRADELARREPA